MIEGDDVPITDESAAAPEMGATGQLQTPSPLENLRAVFEQCYAEAERIVDGDIADELDARLGTEQRSLFRELGQIRHAARGVALTLCAYKVANPDQDVRCHKADQEGGFAARIYDTKVTCPFLLARGLARNVETHWLSQTFSFAGPYLPNLVLKTQPKTAGPAMIKGVNLAQDNGPDYARSAVTAVLVEMIKIRNAGRVVLTRPKDQSIEATMRLLQLYLSERFRSNTPRIPQILMYAIYKSIVASVGRYAGMTLEPLARMKSADRKAGTVGDIVLTLDGKPVEAVETKFEQKVSEGHVLEAIEKVRSESVTRYYILSDAGPIEQELDAIQKQVADFARRNGCEIIINGVSRTIWYYLRLLPDTTDFINNVVDVLEVDEDLDYEHRLAWNDCCARY